MNNDELNNVDEMNTEETPMAEEMPVEESESMEPAVEEIPMEEEVPVEPMEEEIPAVEEAVVEPMEEEEVSIVEEPIVEPMIEEEVPIAEEPPMGPFGEELPPADVQAAVNETPPAPYKPKKETNKGLLAILIILIIAVGAIFVLERFVGMEIIGLFNVEETVPDNNNDVNENQASAVSDAQRSAHELTGNNMAAAASTYFQQRQMTGSEEEGIIFVMNGELQGIFVDTDLSTELELTSLPPISNIMEFSVNTYGMVSLTFNMDNFTCVYNSETLVTSCN